jgi:hypothetical protein
MHDDGNMECRMHPDGMTTDCRCAVHRRKHCESQRLARLDRWKNGCQPRSGEKNLGVAAEALPTCSTWARKAMALRKKLASVEEKFGTVAVLKGEEN